MSSSALKVNIPPICKPVKKHRQRHVFTSIDVTSAITIARRGIFSGFEGTIVVDLGSEGRITFECTGQNQDQQDILEYMMSHHVVSYIDESGSLMLGSVLSDYFYWKGIKADSRTFKSRAKKLQDLKIEIKAGRTDGSSPSVGFVGYLDREESRDEYIKAAPIRVGKSFLQSSIVQNKEHTPSVKPGEIFYIQIMPLFVRFLESVTTMKYPALVPVILSLKPDSSEYCVDGMKRCARFFFSHTGKDGWTVHADKKKGWSSTRVLCSLLWLDHMLEDENGNLMLDKHIRNRRERALKHYSTELFNRFGIIFDETNDRWTYKRHPKVTYQIPKKTGKSQIT